MNASVVFLIVSTLCVGILTGCYIYFITGGPSEYSWNLESRPKAFEIIVEEKGACETTHTCSSFQIDARGDMSFVALSSDGESMRSDDRLEGDVVDEIESLITDKELDSLVSLYSKKCTRVLRDDTYERIEITKGEDVHVVYSCPQDEHASHVALFTLLYSYSELMSEKI